jgi:hypothetical protein
MVHISVQSSLSRVEKKVVVPNPKRIWRRKETPSVISSSDSQEGGGGEAGRQNLKMAKKRGVVADITPPVGAEPPTLRTMLFQGIMRASMYLLVFPRRRR